ncbi:hypothetical protein B0T49_11535 [Chromobacterium violaceum]|nr:DUF4239 domain-containing protein [Chromobacterium violaceum]OLZ80628.1 hypothetical protein BS642_09730 [Chromobacterium violaceum]OQS47246.1 hypothetical protein B0T48_13335 [Chromobacterium violaceum]OQS50323.1 hypothetical protein B0T49_11535 [Chromobacterium violaceum]
MNTMLLHFISLPSSAQIALWAAAGCACAALVHLLLRKLAPDHVTQKQSDEVGVIIAVVGIFYGLIIAALLVRAINHFDASSDIVEREAELAGSLYRMSAQGLPSARQPVKDNLLAYLDAIVSREWPLQQKGEEVPAGSPELGRLSRTLAAVRPADRREAEYLSLAQNQLNGLYASRHARLSDQAMTIPLDIWWVSLIGEVLLIFFAWLMHVPSKAVHFFLTCAMAASISIVLAIILIYDTPFYGDISVSPEPYHKTLRAIRADSLDG